MRFGAISDQAFLIIDKNDFAFLGQTQDSPGGLELSRLSRCRPNSVGAAAIALSEGQEKQRR